MTHPAGAPDPLNSEVTADAPVTSAGHAVPIWPAEVDSSGAPTSFPTCPRHPGTVSYVTCQRCQRPVCPACQRPAAVGVQCVDCVRAAASAMPAPRSIVGGRAAVGAPVITTGLIALCVVVFLGQATMPGVTDAIVLSGSNGKSQPWRMLTSAVAHGGILHLAFNMYALWIMGSALEPLLGRLRFAALAVLSALGGSIAYLLTVPRPEPGLPALDGGVVGASGAVFGLFLAFVIIGRQLGRDMQGMVAIVVINLVISFTVPGIAWQSHIGGALIGAVVAALILLARQLGNQLVSWAGMAGLAALLLAVWWARYYI